MKQPIIFCLLTLLFSCGGNDSSNEAKNNQANASINNEDQTSSEDDTKSKYEFQVEDACGFDKSMVNETVYSFDSDREAESALKRVMRLTGLPANFEIRAASVPNAAAVIKCDRNGNNCNRYILYNQEFMEKVKDETKTNYAELAILAHEIAHHLSGHTISNTGSSYDMELEADKFAGFMLYKMGASIAETKQSFSNLPTQGSSSHPPRSARIAAVTNGWYDAKRNGEITSPPIPSAKKDGSNSPTRTQPNSGNESSLKVGSSYLGGFVYEINGSGTHGKVVKKFINCSYDEAMKYLNAHPWYLPSESDYNEISESLGASHSNYFNTYGTSYSETDFNCRKSQYWIPNTAVKVDKACDNGSTASLFRFKKKCYDLKYCTYHPMPLLLIKEF